MNIDPREIRTLVRFETRRTGAPLHDEDLAQEAALKAIEAVRRQIAVRYPRAFLRKVVSDAVRDHWRRKRPAETLHAVDERRLAESPRFEEELDRRRRTELLRRGLARLDEAKRTTLELFYVQDVSVAEIARTQGRSVSAVKMELLRARRMLREMIREMETEKPNLRTVKR